MIFGRLLAVAIASVALVACGGVVLVSLVFALWSLLAPILGATGATAAVVFLPALMAALGAAVATAVLRPAPKAAAKAAPTLDLAIGFVKRRPVMAVVAAAGAIAVTVVQPRLAAAVIGNLFRRAREART